jgi:D-3-phosphoglycerate dehydrogenase
MDGFVDLSHFRVVRLNATLFPVSGFEADLYRQNGIAPVLVEANAPADVIAHVADCDALLAVSVALPSTVVESLGRCRVISRLGTGTDKIAVDVATGMGILVTNVPWFCIQEQADHTMALLLSVVRKIPQMSRAMAEGAFNRGQELSRTNRRMGGRTLGLVGFGNSARLVAERARGFGLHVIATRRNIAAGAVDGVEMTDLHTVLRQSDYLSLHLPLTPETRHIIDAAAIACMKPGAVLINTSRGALVDEAALAEALRSGYLDGAGLDTFEQVDVFTEAAIQPRHMLLDFDNTVLTPHAAAGSVESAQDVARGGIGNLAAVLTGHWPPAENVVNPAVVPRICSTRGEHGLAL